MGVSVDGFVNDRTGDFAWTPPDEDQFRVHYERVAGLGGYLLGRRLYEAMLPWETDPAMRGTETMAAFADAWTALPKVVFSRTLEHVQGNARLAEGSVPEEVGAVLAGTDRDVEIGGADVAGQAIEAGLVDELRIFRHPVVVGGGTPFLPLVAKAIQFALVETRPFGGGVIYERYRRDPAALDGS
jgi:dihydrofolate reductase